MHIVFIVGNYFPYYSAVGKCIGNIAEELAKKNEVTVICLKNSTTESNEEILNNHKIIRINTKEFSKRNYLKGKILESNKFKKRIFKTIDINYRLMKNFRLILSKTTIKNDLVESYTEALKGIKEPIDVIIPSSMPFESVLAANYYKKNSNKNVIMIPYLFDQFVENSSLHRFTFLKFLKRSKHLELESEVINNSDRVLLTPHLENYFNENYSQENKKFLTLEHPLLKNYLKKKVVKHKNVKFVYTGSFYKKIRNPSYMLSFMNKILRTSKADLFLYTFGDCIKIVNKYTEINKNIYSLGQVANEEAQSALQEADFLIAVGNSDESQVPSKTFEYLSFGKPIIYFYSNNNDTSLEVLKKYPLALCLKQTNELIKENEIKFIDFCQKNYGKKMLFEEIEKIFIEATPEYNATLIEKEIITSKD